MAIKAKNLVELINKKKSLKLKPNEVNAIVNKLKIADIRVVRDKDITSVTKLIIKASRSKAPTIKHTVVTAGASDVFKRKCPRCKASMEEVKLLRREADYCPEDRIVLPRKVQES